MGNLIGGVGADTQVGLMAYGHRREGDCGDIETILSAGPLDSETFLERVNGITPTGKTPLTDAVEQAAEALSFRNNPATVILISDGLESCERDPCALAETLERAGVDFTAHVVCFGLGGNENTASLACIADAIGGRFLVAANAQELGAAFSEVGVAVAEPAPQPEAEPTPVSDVALSAAERVIQGSAFTIGWSPLAREPRDLITVVPVGADEPDTGNFIRAQDESEGELIAPADPGLYELRYVLEEGPRVLATAQVEVTEPVVTISAPDQTRSGEEISVGWSAGIHPRDYIVMVPAGSPDDENANFRRVGEAGEMRLAAPEDPGLYELRYVLAEGSRVLARSSVEVLPAGAQLSTGATLILPESAAPGSEIDVAWEGEPAEGDLRLAVARADQAIFTWISAISIDGPPPVPVQMPQQPGEYELRLLDIGNQKVLSRAPVLVE
ncbi:vWA domain-containing protein [Qingshengfaniella alkalisoli]|nr:hypothetical protein [Qingshengfaniella alkalisoli]